MTSNTNELFITINGISFEQKALLIGIEPIEETLRAGNCISTFELNSTKTHMIVFEGYPEMNETFVGYKKLQVAKKLTQEETSWYISKMANLFTIIPKTQIL